MTVTINQKRDKFPGVMFGDDIDSTYKKAWKKVLNPPRLNIYVPVKVNETKEFAPHLQTPNPDDNRLNGSDNIEIRGKSYDKYADDNLAPQEIEKFIYANGPENVSAEFLKLDKTKGRHYIEVYLEKGKIYEAEYYIWNRSDNHIKAGIGIFNFSDQIDAEIEILKEDSRTGYDINITDNLSMFYGSKMTYFFMKDNKNKSVIIPNVTGENGGFKPILYDTLVEKNSLCNGRIRFKVISKDSLTLALKIFFVSNTIEDIQEDLKNNSSWEWRAGRCRKFNSKDFKLIDYTKSKDSKYEEERGQTGTYNHIRRRYYLEIEEEFTFCLGKDNDDETSLGKLPIQLLPDGAYGNEDEFEQPEDYLPLKRAGNLGNYGIIYTFKGLLKEDEKKECYVMLRPMQKNYKGIYYSAIYTIKANGNWNNYNATNKEPAIIKLTGGSSIWFVLGGGNFGMVQIKYSRSSPGPESKPIVY